MKKKKTKRTGEQKTCWLTAHTRLHPETKCVYSNDELHVATDGKKRWISCEGCHKTWPVSPLV